MGDHQWHQELLIPKRQDSLHVEQSDTPQQLQGKTSDTSCRSCQANKEVDSDDVQEQLDSHNQELTMDELIEMHEQKQDIEELESNNPVQSEDPYDAKPTKRKLDDAGASEINRLYPESWRKVEKERLISEITPPARGGWRKRAADEDETGVTSRGREGKSQHLLDTRPGY
ncbi:hypothetical protein TNCV_1811461 [Trichonephila clavipes]|nr:hypothetical protein TNCV_1811461 [Trichonephila clavipes]